MEIPVQIVDLKLAEFHVIAVSFQETLDHIQISMSGKSKMADAAIFFLFHQIGEDSIFFIIQISIDIHLPNIVEEIKIKIVYLAFF